MGGASDSDLPTAIGSEHDRLKDLKAFDNTKTGVKGLVDAGIVKIPKIFIRPPDDIIKASAAVLTHIQIPIIDLDGVESDRRLEIVDEIRCASETWGFFQVVNHGVPVSVLDEMIEGVRRFFEQPDEVKMEYYSRDSKRKVLYSSNFDLYQSTTADWKDTLICKMAPDPLDPHELPAACRDINMEYSKYLTGLGTKLFELLSEALGLNPNYLKDIGCVSGHGIISHYYPPCPQPDLTLGTTHHSDSDFITVLLQDHIGGLQVLHQNQWVDVSPMHGALVVNVGDLLQGRNRHMDSQPELLGAQVHGSTESSNTKLSSSRKRGITRGASLLVQPDRKKVLKTNEFGQPNEDCSDHRAFASHVGVLTRSHIQIIYQDFHQVPREQIRMVTERLSQFYEFEGQDWDASLEYVTKRINEAWRNYKRRLTAKYITSKDPIAVRDGPAPPGIPMEDWRVFVDQRTTDEFKRASARNKINRAKLKGPACLGRHSMAVTCHNLAMEKNLTSDAEIRRCEVFLRAHTRKDKVVQYLDLVKKLEELSSSNPASRMTGMDDALTELVGSDKRGRMRGLGCSISKVGLKKSAPARSKVENVTKEKESVVQELSQVKKKLDNMTQDIVEVKKTLVDMQKERQFTQNLS